MHQSNNDWKWYQTTQLNSKSFICGHCGEKISSQEGFTSVNHEVRIYICHVCNKPTFFSLEGDQIPGPLYGGEIEDIPTEEIKNLYREARSCISVSAYTASVLCSRKLLMNIAVSKGAREGQSFKQYMDYLDQNNYIPPDGKDWVDHIRNKGNEATHEIKEMSKDDAEELIDFLNMLMKFIFEFPAKIKNK